MIHKLFSLWRSIQQHLFTYIEENLEPLTEKEQEFVRVVELSRIDEHIVPYRWVGNGRKPEDRKSLALSFILLPIMLYHALQLIVVSAMARKMSSTGSLYAPNGRKLQNL